MIFSKKEITLVYTVEQCNSCDTQHKRKFKKGDILFTEIGSCTSCSNGKFYIDMIYGETLKQ